MVLIWFKIMVNWVLLNHQQLFSFDGEDTFYEKVGFFLNV